MHFCRMRPILLLQLLVLSVASTVQAQWTFTGNTTPTWQEAITRFAQLDSMHRGARMVEIGHDDNGLPICKLPLNSGRS